MSEVSASGEMVGNMLYLEGTVSEGSMRNFVLTMEDGAKVNVQMDDDTQTTLQDGLLDNIKVAVGCIRIDDDHVRACTITDAE